jgi:uncharacterized protein (DUF2147 family)
MEPRMNRVFAILSLYWAVQSAVAQTSAVGLWQTVDDTTGRPRAEVRITETSGVLTGHIERSLLPNPGGQLQRCVRCEDDRRDQPLLGLAIIRQLTASGDKQTWDGGQILDPDTGQVYRLRIRLMESGRQLEVRGFVGPFFRNQLWTRLP